MLAMARHSTSLFPHQVGLFIQLPTKNKKKESGLSNAEHLQSKVKTIWNAQNASQNKINEKELSFRDSFNSIFTDTHESMYAYQEAGSETDCIIQSQHEEVSVAELSAI